MRFTATSKFTSIARGAAKVLRWNVYAKKTSSLSEPLGSGTWINCTSRVTDLPPMGTKVEYQLGAFSSDVLTLPCADINWWETNIFNTSVGQVIEMKVVMQLGLSETDLASDIVYAFSGLVDPMTIHPNERSDTLTLQIYTADELANRMTAETLVTRYIKSDVGGVPGLEFKTLTGVWVTNANITDYVLKAGLHTIAYEYNSGSFRLKLDDGRWVSIGAGGFITLGNAVADVIDTERVVVCAIVAELLTVDVTEDVIVKTAGDTLPYVWYKSVSVRTFLELGLQEVGITSLQTDTLQLASYDGASYLSYLGQAPGDTVEPTIRAMAAKSDNTLCIAVDAKVYSRNYSDESFTLLATIPSNVDRLLYDATNNWLWIIYGSGTKLCVYKFATSALTAEHSLGATANIRSVDKFEANSAVLFTTTAQTIRQVTFDGGSFTESQLFTAAGLTPAYTSFEGWGQIGDNSRYYFNGIASGNRYVHYIAWSGSAWIDGANFNSYIEAFTVAAFDANSLTLYYWASFTAELRYMTSATEDLVIELATDSILDIYYHPAMTLTYAISVNAGTLYSLSGGAWTVAANFDAPNESAQLMTSSSTMLFGGASGRRLWQYGTTLAMYLSEVDCKGMQIKQALTKASQAFNLMYHISSIKAAYVYRRGNDSGTPQTSGSNLTVNTDLAEDLSKENLYGKAFDLISIDNGIEKHTYDGTTGPVVFDKGIFGDKRVLEITNNWIPTELIPHLLYQMWQFFKTDRSLYRIPLGNVTLFQYEIMDKLTASFSSSKISVSGWGPIMSQALYKDGSMDLEVLI